MFLAGFGGVAMGLFVYSVERQFLLNCAFY